MTQTGPQSLLQYFYAQALGRGSRWLLKGCISGKGEAVLFTGRAPGLELNTGGALIVIT